MNNWPNWIPKPNSWLSAILLILLVRGIAVTAVPAVMRHTKYSGTGCKKLVC